MQLFISVGKNWRCVEVDLVEGCVPRIGGAALPEQQIEPAQWFKVLVLDSVCVDCSQHVVWWNVSSDGAVTGNPASVSDHIPTKHRCVSSSVGNPLDEGPLDVSHSLMAACDDGKDDLQTLFDLAETVFGQPDDPNSDPQHCHDMEHMWLRLLHCYLLPLITFHHEDLEAVSLAKDKHIHSLLAIDQRMEEVSIAISKLKEDLARLFSNLLPCVENWAALNVCSTSFLSHITTDIRSREQEARAKIQSCATNIDFNERLGKSSKVFGSEFEKQKTEAEQQLLKLLKLRSILEGGATNDELTGPNEVSEMQIKYVHLHTELDHLRKKSSTLSSEKVLTLSVREAFEQTLAYLVSGQATSGLDVGLQGGHSTDVLREASSCEGTSYLTWRDKIKKLLQMRLTPLAQLHQQFSCDLRILLTSGPSDSDGKGSGPVSKSLAPLVNGHYEKVVDHICEHFSDHCQDFSQRVWLCYERLLFESFSEGIFSLYQTEQLKSCQQLMTNAIGLSVTDPHNLELGIIDESWLHLFPPRSFVTASLLYMQVAESSEFLSCALKRDSSADRMPYMKYFGGVSSDLFSLPLAISPLDKLQVLISAFRKAMAGLAQLKVADPAAVKGSGPHAVSCDEILPVLVLLVVHLPPWLLAVLHINCCLLTDFMAPFLSPGWHGYSLATFTSTLHVINRL